MDQQQLNTVLSKHKKWLENSAEGERADLRYANLIDADLSEANLIGADLRYADLRYANLRGADLRYANLRDADLRDADLRDADLRYADLRYANLIDADLRDADLRDASTQLTYGPKILSVDNVGTFNGKVTFIPHLNKVFAGCWDGNLEEFLERGLRMNEHDETQRKNMKLIYDFFRNNKEEGLNEE